jgi:hypothetical protein
LAMKPPMLSFSLVTKLPRSWLPIYMAPSPPP